MTFKGTFNGPCLVCTRPRFKRAWETGDGETCIDCWFDVLAPEDRKAEAKRVYGHQ